MDAINAKVIRTCRQGDSALDMLVGSLLTCCWVTMQPKNGSVTPSAAAAAALGRVCMQSKVMLRIEEPNSDFVRLLVRAVALPPAPPVRATAYGNHPPSDTGASGPTESSSQQEGTAISSVQEGIAPALSPAAVESLLSQSSGCKVLLQEESRWLVVSDTFSPGDILRQVPKTAASASSITWRLGFIPASFAELFALQVPQSCAPSCNALQLRLYSIHLMSPRTAGMTHHDTLYISCSLPPCLPAGWVMRLRPPLCPLHSAFTRPSPLRRRCLPFCQCAATA